MISEVYGRSQFFVNLPEISLVKEYPFITQYIKGLQYKHPEMKYSDYILMCNFLRPGILLRESIFRTCFLILERGRKINVETSIHWAESHTCPDWWLDLQHRYVPWLGIELLTFRFMRQSSNQMSHTGHGSEKVLIKTTLPSWACLWKHFHISYLL